MGKSNVTAWVDSKAKDGFRNAAGVSQEPRRGETGIIENIGLQLERECARVPRSGTYDVQVTLVPAQK